MRTRIPATSVAQTMLLIWLAVVILALVGCTLWRWWRQKHPKLKPQLKASYSQLLQNRLAARRHSRKATKRRGPPGPGHPRHH